MVDEQSFHGSLKSIQLPEPFIGRLCFLFWRYTPQFFTTIYKHEEKNMNIFEY